MMRVRSDLLKKIASEEWNENAISLHACWHHSSSKISIWVSETENKSIKSVDVNLTLTHLLTHSSNLVGKWDINSLPLLHTVLTSFLFDKEHFFEQIAVVLQIYTKGLETNPALQHFPSLQHSFMSQLFHRFYLWMVK